MSTYCFWYFLGIPLVTVTTTLQNICLSISQMEKQKHQVTHSRSFCSKGSRIRAESLFHKMNPNLVSLPHPTCLQFTDREREANSRS